jgi:hypothetical protein
MAGEQKRPSHSYRIRRIPRFDPNLAAMANYKGAISICQFFSPLKMASALRETE